MGEGLTEKITELKNLGRSWDEITKEVAAAGFTKKNGEPYGRNTIVTFWQKTKKPGITTKIARTAQVTTAPKTIKTTPKQSFAEMIIFNPWLTDKSKAAILNERYGI